MIFDSHAHYDDKQFDTDRETLLLSMEENGIGTILNVGSDMRGSVETVELTEKYDFIYGAIGIHPSDIKDLNEESYQWLKENADRKKIVAIGEIGLDYYWEKEEKIQEEQQYWLKRQLELAKEVNLPVIVHSRDAAEDTLKWMGKYAGQVPGVIHCFSYSKEIALEIGRAHV